MVQAAAAQKAPAAAEAAPSMAAVRPHTAPAAGNLQDPLASGATAFARGSDIHLAPSAAALSVGHEAFHIVQQAGGARARAAAT